MNVNNDVFLLSDLKVSKMPKNTANIPEVQEDEEDQEQMKTEVKVNKKTGKPLLSDEEKKKIRLANLEKAIQAKREKGAVTTLLVKSKKELSDLQVQRTREELAVVNKQIEKMKNGQQVAKTKPKKKKIIVEDTDEETDEEEEVVVKPKKKVAKPDVDYGHLLKQSAAEQIRKNLENEHIKMAMLSIMPGYRF